MIRKKIAASVQNGFFELGLPAFDHISDCIRKRRLSPRQMINSLHILYGLSREKCYGKQSDVFDIAGKLMTENDIEVRSEAAAISVCLANVFDQFPDLNAGYNRKQFASKIREMLNIGLSDRAKPLAEKYLSSHCFEKLEN